MSNIAKVKKLRKPVMVELDAPLAGTHELRFTLEAFGEMEEEYGTVKDAIEQTKTGKMKPITFMLWAGLLYEQESPEDLSLRKVSKAINVADLDYYVDAISRALESDLPEDNVENPNK